MSGDLSKEEINRKLLHVLAVVLPAGIFYGPDFLRWSDIWACILALSLTCFSIFVEVARLRNGSFGKWFLLSFGLLLRKEEKHQLTGATYLIAGGAICSLISLQGEGAAACAFIGLTFSSWVMRPLHSRQSLWPNQNRKQDAGRDQSAVACCVLSLVSSFFRNFLVFSRVGEGIVLGAGTCPFFCRFAA